jgi:hypothetical protein
MSIRKPVPYKTSGTNTTGFQRRGTAPGERLKTFGKAAQKDSQRQARGSWWIGVDRATFYKLAAEYQGDMKPAMLPLKSGGDFS